jgi:hypothetical protein
MKGSRDSARVMSGYAPFTAFTAGYESKNVTDLAAIPEASSCLARGLKPVQQTP